MALTKIYKILPINNVCATRSKGSICCPERINLPKNFVISHTSHPFTKINGYEVGIQH